MLIFKVFPLLMMTRINVMALPQYNEQSLETIACPKEKDILEAMPDDAANFTASGITYRLFSLPMVMFNRLEAKDFLYTVAGELASPPTMDNVPPEGYKKVVPRLGEKGMMYKTNRYRQSTRFSWAFAIEVENRLIDAVATRQRFINIHGFAVEAYWGEKRLAWGRLTYDNNEYPNKCPGIIENGTK